MDGQFCNLESQNVYSTIQFNSGNSEQGEWDGFGADAALISNYVKLALDQST